MQVSECVVYLPVLLCVSVLCVEIVSVHICVCVQAPTCLCVAVCMQAGQYVCFMLCMSMCLLMCLWQFGLGQPLACMEDLHLDVVRGTLD